MFRSSTACGSMSSSLISRSADLSALAAAKYNIEILGGYLVVRHIPYLDASGEVRTADIVTALNLVGGIADSRTIAPADHTVWWTGYTPHTISGESMTSHLVCASWVAGRDLGEGITVTEQWSRKLRANRRPRQYTDFREKIETYVAEVAGHAEAKRPGTIDACKHGYRPKIHSGSRFHYTDTSTYRNGTRGIESRIEDEVVGIIGIGGTGSYLVDVLAKTNIKEIHLFDDDTMDTHSAFRVAGAARAEELGSNKRKVDWHHERYDVVRKEGLFIHRIRVDDESLALLDKCTTVFIAVDDLDVRRTLQSALTRKGIFHMAVGIGLDIEGVDNDELGGNVKIEIDFRDPHESGSTDCNTDCSEDGVADDVYRSNIQTAELNMLGAALAITEWKATRRVYRTERSSRVDSLIYSSTTGKILVARKGL